MGYLSLNIEGIFKQYNTFMIDYYTHHPEDLLNSLHGIPYTMEQMKQFNSVPLCSYTGGVVTYLSNKSCKILLKHMESINWNIFDYNEVYGFPYIIEDIGIGFILNLNNIKPYPCELYTNDFNRLQYSIALHTNKYK